MDVIFFPRNDYPNNVEVCNHRLGKRMTYTEQTDTLAFGTSYTQFMTLAKANNIKVGAFVRYSELSATQISQAIEDEQNGNLWLDQYDECPYLAEKLNNREQISQEEFVNAYTHELMPAFLETIGRKPVAMSYRNGVDNFKDYVLPYYLAARNSVPSGSFDVNTFPTDYGLGFGNPNNEAYSFARYKSKASTMRWYDAARANNNDFQGELQTVSSKIDETLLNGGWLNNFTHWHHYWQQGNQQWAETYLDLLASKNSNGEIYFAGYGEAVAYLVYRQLITKAVMYSPNSDAANKLVIRLETINNLGIDTDLLQVPISVKFSTVGTPLAGQTIKSNCSLISFGSGQYIVEIPYAKYPVVVIEKVNI